MTRIQTAGLLVYGRLVRVDHAVVVHQILHYPGGVLAVGQGGPSPVGPERPAPDLSVADPPQALLQSVVLPGLTGVVGQVDVLVFSHLERNGISLRYNIFLDYSPPDISDFFLRRVQSPALFLER